MFFIIYAPLQFFLLYRLGPFAQVSVADDLFQAVCCRSFIQIRKIKGKSCIASQIVIYIGTYLQMMNYEKALEFADKALAINDKLVDFFIMSNAY